MKHYSALTRSTQAANLLATGPKAPNLHAPNLQAPNLEARAGLEKDTKQMLSDTGVQPQRILWIDGIVVFCAVIAMKS